MSWWLSDVLRAKQERLEVAELAERVRWLSVVNWRVGENLQLAVDFDLTHQGEIFVLSMAYPSTFPDTPPMVTPRNSKRLSNHQYGAGGELCLEYRPDNWGPAVSGAMMIESAYRLISGERPENKEPVAVPSVHQASVGRELRGENMRFIIPEEVLGALDSLTPNVPVPIQAWDSYTKPTWVAVITNLGADDIAIWSTAEPRPATAHLARGFVLRTEYNVGRFQTEATSFLDSLPTEFPVLAALVPEDFKGFILLGNGCRWITLNLFTHEGKRFVFNYKTLIAPATAGRLPIEYAVLAGKHVAIVGCGSVGSKIAVTLARAGIRNFTLVDEDVFFAANLVRNELDAGAIGLHKVDALTTRLKEIAGSANINCRRVALGQQESAGTTESVMEDLAKANLVIDATADPRAFNLVGAVARRTKMPMVWCQVFAGGIGGIVARLRPDLDPVPSSARDQIQTWCESHGITWQDGADRDYSGRSEDGTPLVADDADVSVIAAHAARMSLDTLVRPQSIFPASAYAIGLLEEWIFAAPFDTWPIDLQPDGTWGADQVQASGEEVLGFLKELFSDGRSA